MDPCQALQKVGGTLNNKNNDCSLVRIAGATRQRCQDSSGKFKTSGCLTSSDKRINAKVGEMVALWQRVGQHVCFSTIFHLNALVILAVDVKHGEI